MALPVLRKHRSPLAFSVIFLCAVAVGVSGTAKHQAPAAVPKRQIKPQERARLAESFGKLPLRFEQNVGQAGPDVRYISRGPGYSLLVTSQGADIAVAQGGKTS